MQTHYVRLCQVHDGPLGRVALTWCATHLMRVTTNRLGRALWEWVADGSPVNIESWRRTHPLVIYDEHR